MAYKHRQIISIAAAITVLVGALALFSLAMTGAASAQEPNTVIGDEPPGDLDCDGNYEDVDGDGDSDVVDVQAMFANRKAIDSRDDATMFDLAESGDVNVVDVQKLFASLGDGSDTRLDLCEVERKVHEFINDERTSHGLSPIDRDTKLSHVARYHGEDMAENDDLSHTGSDGSDFSQRYEEFGYECRAPKDDGGYSLGAENIAQTYYQAPLTGGAYHGTEDELARAVVDRWMNSPGHKDNILKDYWNNQGIGLATINDGGNTKVYVTQNFC